MSFLNEVRLEDTFSPFLEFQETFGFIPNLLHAQTLLPRVIEAQAILEKGIRLKEGAISRVQKERILLSVAVDRQDAYCVALDSKVLSSLGVADGQVDDLLSDYRKTNLSAADSGSLRFCLKLARYAPSVTWEDVEALRTCGLEDGAILEAVVVTALALYRSTLSLGLGPEPDYRSRKPASKTIDPPRERPLRDVSSATHEVARRKGAYVAAPYLSPKTFAPFAVVQKS